MREAKTTSAAAEFSLQPVRVVAFRRQEAGLSSRHFLFYIKAAVFKLGNSDHLGVTLNSDALN